MSHGRFLSLVGVVALLTLVIFASTWIHLGIRFDRPCRLFPKQEWVVLQTDPDAFEARLMDRRNSNRQQIDLYRFDRGDLVRFRLSDGLSTGAKLAAGAEVARFESILNRQLFDQLRPQLEEAEANVRAASTGQRAEVVALARSEIAAAEAERDRLDAEYERSRTLHSQGLLSDAMFESIEAQFRQAEANLQTAKNSLRVAEVGEKTEIVEAWQAKRDALRQMIADAGGRLEADRVRCPIAGEVVTLQGDSALVRVAALDTLFAVAPVPPSRVGTLAPGQSAAVTPMGTSPQRLEGQVVQVDGQASTVLGMSFYWVTVAVPNPERLPVAGVRGKVEFRGQRVTLLGWLSDRLRHAGDRTLGA